MIDEIKIFEKESIEAKELCNSLYNDISNKIKEDKNNNDRLSFIFADICGVIVWIIVFVAEAVFCHGKINNFLFYFTFGVAIIMFLTLILKNVVRLYNYDILISETKTLSKIKKNINNNIKIIDSDLNHFLKTHKQGWDCRLEKNNEKKSNRKKLNNNAKSLKTISISTISKILIVLFYIESVMITFAIGNAILPEILLWDIGKGNISYVYCKIVLIISAIFAYFIPSYINMKLYEKSICKFSNRKKYLDLKNNINSLSLLLFFVGLIIFFGFIAIGMLLITLIKSIWFWALLILLGFYIKNH